MDNSIVEEYFSSVSSPNVTLDQIRSIPKKYLSNDYIDDEKRTILFRACVNPKITVDMIKVLIERGSDIKYQRQYYYDNSDDDFLFNLCRNPGLTINLLKFALSFGFDINKFNRRFITPIYLVVQVNGPNFYQVFTFMVTNGAKIEDERFGTSILNHYCDHEITIPTLSLFLMAGAKLTSHVFKSIMEISNVDAELLQYCIDVGEKNIIQDSHCLSRVCMLNTRVISDQVIEILLEHGLEIDKKLIITPLQELCINPDATKEQIECLIRHGADFGKYNDESSLHPNVYKQSTKRPFDDESSPYNMLIRRRGQEFADSIEM